MKSKLKDNQGITLVVVLMVMAILLSVVGPRLPVQRHQHQDLWQLPNRDTGILRRRYRDQRRCDRNNAGLFSFFNRSVSW